MDERSDAHLELKVSADFLKRLEAWRRDQPGIPTREEAAYRLMAIGLETVSQTGRRFWDRRTDELRQD